MSLKRRPSQQPWIEGERLIADQLEVGGFGMAWVEQDIALDGDHCRRHAQACCACALEPGGSKHLEFRRSWNRRAAALGITELLVGTALTNAA